MKKLFTFMIVSLLFLGTATISNAQVKVGVNVGPAIPVGDSWEGFETGFGGGLNFRYVINEQIGLGAEFSYYSMGIEGDAEGFSYNLVPIQAAAEYYFMAEGFKPYAGLNLGVTVNSSKVEFLGTSVSNSESYFTVAPKVGFLYSTGPIEIGLDVKYNIQFADSIDSETGEETTETAGFLTPNVVFYYVLGQ